VKNYLALSFLALFLGGIFFQILVGFPTDLDQAQAPTEQGLGFDDEITQKMQGVHLVESQEGARDWELFAESAEGSEESGSWSLKKVKVFFYNEEKVDFTVTGETGRIESKTRDLSIEGKVTTQSANGYRFQTASVSYNSKERRIFSPDFVLMTSPADAHGGRMKLEGYQMNASVEQALMRIESRVQARKPFRNGKDFVISAEAAQFSGTNQSAQFFGNVELQVGPVKMQGPEAEFVYKSGVDLLDSVVLKGGVRLQDEDKFATSDVVSFDPTKNQFEFKGSPRVIQNTDELTGDKIIFLDGGKRVKVENIKARMESNE
jgi:LPS export ABC transporter protein LptC